MKLSTRTQYGLRMLCQLALDYNVRTLQMSEIGSREGISEKYLGQIMLILKSSGLVLSIRGSQGGYYLSRPPGKIQLTEIFTILEGEIFEFDEASAKGGNMVTSMDRRDTLDATSEIWIRIREAIRNVLDQYTLDDVVRLGLFKSGYLDFHI